MPKKEASNKAREWERERRERLNDSFNLLSTLLPSYDPSVTRSKIEILQKAVAYISDLQKENRELVKTGKDQTCWKQVRHLKHRVEGLLRRIHQLARLLNDAGISIPPELPKDGYQPLSGRQPKWSNKFRQEDAATLLEKVKSKRNEKKKQKNTPNACGNKVNCSGKRTDIIVSTVSGTSRVNTTITTSRTKLCRVAKNKKIPRQENKKSTNGGKSVGCEKLPTVTQLLGLSLNDIDVAPPQTHPPGGGDLHSNNFVGVTPNTSGTNVTVLTSNVPQVPQGFIVIPRANSVPSTSTNNIPQPQCFVVSPASQAVPSSQHAQPSAIVMPSKTQMSKVVKTATGSQQSMSVVLSQTTNELESTPANPNRKLNSSVAVTNSHLLTTPIMATGIQSSPTPALLPSQGTNLTGLGPGTLILANGSILPILPPPQAASVSSSVLAPRSNTQIVMNSGSNMPAPVLPNQPVILVQNKVHTTSHVFGSSNVKPRRIYSLCLPKPLKRKGIDSTRTTFANKVPISALTPRNSITRSSATNMQSLQNVVNKISNKSDESRNSKRVSDRKTNSVNKGASKNSKNNCGVNSKKSSINIRKKELQSTVHSCENMSISKISKVSTSPSVNLTLKENSSELVRNDGKVTEIHLNGNDTHEIVNNNSSVEHKGDQDLTSTNSCNKRKGDDTADSNMKSSKQRKFEFEVGKCGSSIINDLSTVCSQSTSASTLSDKVQDSLACVTVNSDNILKKTDDDKHGVIDNYSISSLCKANEKNILATNENSENIDCSFDKVSQRSSCEESFTPQKEVPHNKETNKMKTENVHSKESEEFSANLSSTNIPSNLNNLACIESNTEYSGSALNPGNDIASTTSSENCMKSPAINVTERCKENIQHAYSTAPESGSESTLEINTHKLSKVASSNEISSNEGCHDITTTTAKSKMNQSLEASCNANDSFEQETCDGKDMSLSLYPHSERDEVPLFPTTGKIQDNSSSRDNTSDVSPLEENFRTDCMTKIQNVIAEHEMSNELSGVSEKINRQSEQSTTCVNNDSNINNLSVKSQQTVVNNNDMENKEKPKGIHETLQTDISEKRNLSSELPSGTEYNSYTPATENNSSLCPANKLYRNTESLDSSTSTSSSLCLTLQNNELSNDLFASLQVPTGGQHSESISPTAAFLLAFPLVSTSKVSDIIGDTQEDVESDSLQGPSTLLQIGSLDSDQHSEAIISRSPAFHSTDRTSKILPQPVSCQKDSTSCTTNSQDLVCHHFIPSEHSPKVDSNLERIKSDSSLKFSEIHKINKSWASVQASSHPQTNNKNSNDLKDQGKLNGQSYSTKCTMTQLETRDTMENCTKPKPLDQICTFNISKEITKEGRTSENIIQQGHTNLQHFTVSQFVSSPYETKEQSPNTKQTSVSQTSALHTVANRNVDFTIQSSNKDENSDFLSEYKENSVLHTSNVGTSMPENASFTIRKDGIEQGTMTDDVRYSPQTVPLETLNKTKQSSTTSYTSSECNDYPVTSQCGYVLPHSSENEKASVPSFSVAHNSSNFSILSWTTLSPVSTMPNTSQYDGFGVQNTQALATSQNGCTSIPKKQSNDRCLSEATAIMPTTSGVSQICHSNLKQAEPVSTTVTHTVQKITDSFPNPVLQSNNNPALANQTSLHHYFNDQRQLQTSIAPTNNSSAASQGSQSYSGGKMSDNEQQHRPPVNWMTAPDIRVGQQSVVPTSSIRNRPLTTSSSTISTAPMEAISCKDIEFCTIGNNQNLYTHCVSTTLPTFDTRTYTSNSFYGCHSVSSQNSQSNFYQSHAEPRQLASGPSDHHSNKMHLANPLNRMSDVHITQHDANDNYTVPWMQRKSCASSISSSEINNSNFVSTSLPTLVGDLALGTNFPLSTSDDITGNKGLQSINFNVSTDEKKSALCETRNDSSEGVREKQVQTAKNSVHDKDQNNVRNSMQEFRSSSQTSGSTFLSVSQLVDQAHSCVGSSRLQTVTRQNNHGSRQITVGTKQNTCQPQSHDLSDPSSTSEDTKRGLSSLNSSNKDSGQKIRQEVGQSLNTLSFRTSESGIVLTHPGEEQNRKIESSHVVGSSNNYVPSIVSSANSVTSVSHGSLNFSLSFNAQPSTSLHTNNITWPTSIDIAKQHNPKTNVSTCKAPASSYSAEALIGLNSPHIANRVTAAVNDSRGNKVISLPPPVVSERFCHHQNYPSSSVSRSLQVPPPFSAETILPSNYFAPMELQNHSQESGPMNNRQTVSIHQSNLTSHSHQNEQGFNNSFTSSATPSSSGATSGQGNSVLYTHSDFMSSVATAHSSHPLPPVSLPCNFLPDLGSNNSYTAGILSDSGNPFIFPTSTIPVSRGPSSCHNSGSGKQTVSHLSVPSHTGPTSTDNNAGHVDSRQIVSALPLVDKETCSGNAALRCNNGSNVSRRTGTSTTSSLHQNSLGGVNNCNSSKQRVRKRTSDTATSSNSSSIGGLMDLGYLGMPPVIGSPMLPDDGTYINHSGAFLSSGTQHGASSLYSGAPNPSQGSFYSTSHSHGQSSTQLPMSHTNHLAINSGSFSSQSTRGLQRNAIVSPSTINSSGTSLTNFNLSTIFPEINEKQVPNHTYSSSGPKEMGPLLSSSLPIPPLSTSAPPPPPAPPPPHLQSSNSSSSHTRQSAALLLPQVSNYVHRQANGETTIRLPPPPPPPPPVPLHSSVTFNNILNSSASQMCRMQWR